MRRSEFFQKYFVGNIFLKKKEEPDANVDSSLEESNKKPD
jgi:hypothetical protein